MTTQYSRLSVMRARSRSVASVLLAALALEQCTHFTPESRPLPEVVAEKTDRTVRITRSGGERLEISHARIAGDSLQGVVPTVRGDLAVSIPLGDVRSVEVEHVNVPLTVVAVAVALGVTALIIAAATPQPPAPAPTQVGSCPLVYSWDGHNWRLDSGTFGGAIMTALERTDLDNLDYATPADGVLRLKVANELDETEHVNALRVLAVDHDPAVAVAPDPAGRIHTLGKLVAPVRAVDFHGRDALARVAAADGWNWESVPTGRDTSRLGDIRDGLELTFIRPRAAQHAHLVLDGNNTPWAAHLLGELVRAHGAGTQAWYDSLNARPAAATALGRQIAREAFLTAAVWTGDRWAPQGLFWEAGPEVVKRQVLDLDLSGTRGDTVRVRLESVPSFWLIDQVALDFTADRPLVVHDLQLTEGRDRHGRDVRPFIEAVDSQYYVMETGDAAELQYRVPSLPAGLARSFMLRSTGWYRVHQPETGPGDTAMLRRVASDPFGVSREAVALLNTALRNMELAAR
jgi:hypothetical protein